ncbi:cell wall anchor protein, partial [Flavobacterium sp. HTF]
GHLENIPSEEEVLKNGINLGEMNSKLLQKIEELTLYSIDQNKKIEEQAKEIEALKSLVSRIAKIESELARK